MSEKTKNYYRQCRESLSPKKSRASAAEAIGNGMTEDILEMIEMEKRALRPEEVVAMSRAYQRPEMCNHYCSNDCAIGRDSIPELDAQKNIATITLEILSALNYIEEEKNRLVDITQDEDLSEDEYADMLEIKNRLEKMSNSIMNLQLWVDTKLAQK